MAVTIREFDGTDADYRAFADIRNAEMKGVARSPASWRNFDEALRNSGRDLRRFLLLEGSTPIGYAHWCEPLFFTAPGRTSLEGVVVLSHRRLGRGRQLFDHVLADGRARGFHEWLAMVSEELEAGCRFLERRGFSEYDREVELWMDLSKPRADDLAARTAGLAREGVTLHTLESLKESVPDWRDRLYDLSISTVHDLPVRFEVTIPDRETFRRLEVDVEGARHDALFLARHGDDWIGMSELRVSEEGTPEVHQEYTTTLPAWRHKGIAHALKLRGFEWARQRGFPTIRTICLESNVAMVGLNEKLGFRRGAAWILYLRNDRPKKA